MVRLLFLGEEAEPLIQHMIVLFKEIEIQPSLSWHEIGQELLQS